MGFSTVIRRSACVLLLACCGLPNLAAQPEDRPPYAHRGLFGRVLSDQRYLVQTWWPAELSRPTFYAPLLATVGLAVTEVGPGASDASLDVAGGAAADRAVGKGEKPVASQLTKLGDGGVLAASLGLSYLVGRMSGNDRLTSTASLSAEALLDTGIWVTGLKLTLARTRPGNGSDGDFFAYHPTPGQQNGSFPSGHTASAFAVAAVLAGQYRDSRPWVPWVSYGLATVVGVSRAGLGRHFPADVAAGALVGQSIGRMVVHRQRETDEERRYHIAPLVDPATGSYGVGVTIDW